MAYPAPTEPGKGMEMETSRWSSVGRDTGALVQRLFFPAGGPPPAPERAAAAGESLAAVRFNLDQLGAVIATPRGLWGLGAARPWAARGAKR